LIVYGYEAWFNLMRVMGRGIVSLLCESYGFDMSIGC